MFLHNLLPLSSSSFQGCKKIRTDLILKYQIKYRIVASRSTSRLVTCLGLFRLLMKGIFGPYVLWPFDKKLIFWIVTRVSARDYTVSWIQKPPIERISEKLDFLWSTYSTKRERYWSFWCQVWSNHQYQVVFWGNGALEAFKKIIIIFSKIKKIKFLISIFNFYKMFQIW